MHDIHRHPTRSRPGLLPLAALAGALAAASCTPAPPPPGSLDARATLRRASLDLRGRIPTATQLDGVAAEPHRLDATIDSYLEDPAFPSAVRDLFARAFRSRFEEYYNPEAIDYGEDPAFQAAVAEEPLMLLADIAAHDRPFTDLVTAEETWVDETLARIWPVSGYDDGAGGWQRVRYDDGRPHAGVVSMNALYFRYSTCGQNYHRGRANALSRILLCDNYLKRPVDFPRDIDLTDEEGIRNAVSTNIACTSCHASLDPMAAFLFGFENNVEGDPDHRYNHATVDGWQDATGATPAYHGRPGSDLTDLGAAIADDPRFLRCAATRVFEGLVGRPADGADFDAISGHVDAFVAGGLTLRSLYRSVLHDPVYRGLPDGERRPAQAKLMTPEVLGDAVADLTGYRATLADIDVMRTDLEGLHALGGGLDARSGDHPPTAPSTSRVLVQARLAEAAAAHLVDQGGPLLDGFSLTQRPPRELLAQLVARTQALPADDARARAFADELAALHDAVRGDGGDDAEAWTALLSALLRDHGFVLY